MSAESPHFTPADVIKEGGLVERGRTDAERRTESLDSIRESLVGHIKFGLDDVVRKGEISAFMSGYVPGEGPFPRKELYLRGDFPGHWDEDLLNNDLFKPEDHQTALFLVQSLRSPKDGTPKISLSVKELDREGQVIKDSELGSLKLKDVDLNDPTHGEFNKQMQRVDTIRLMRLAKLLSPDRTTPITSGQFRNPNRPLGEDLQI